MIFKTTSLLIILATAALLASPARAQVIDWSGVNAFTGDSDIDATGFIDGLRGYQTSSSAQIEVNGVEFNANTGSYADGTFSLGTTAGGTDGYVAVGSTNYQELLYGCAATFSTATVTISGLTSGDVYAVQVFNSSQYDQTTYADTVNPLVDNVSTNYGWVTGTFTAGGDTASFTYTSDGRAGTIDAIDLRSVPEASTWAMMLLGVGLLGGIQYFRSRSRAV